MPHEQYTLLRPFKFLHQLEFTTLTLLGEAKPIKATLAIRITVTCKSNISAIGLDKFKKCVYNLVYANDKDFASPTSFC